MVHPQHLQDLLHYFEPLRNVLVGLLQDLQLVEDVVKDILHHLYVLHLSSLLDALLNRLQEALLLVLADRRRVELFDVLEPAVEYFELFEILDGVGVRQQNGDELG